MESWVPPWAEGMVEGSYTPFDPEDPEQRIRAKCLECGEEFQRTCGNGNARAWISHFAAVHQRLHSQKLRST